jgi:putative ABC transport system permease protein
VISLIFRNLFRSRRRSALTFLGVAVAIFVYAALQAAVDGIFFPVRQASNGRLLSVREKGRASVLASRLPQSVEATIGAMDSVAGATGVFTDLAVMRVERVHVFVHGVDPEPYRKAKGLVLPDDAWRRFLDDRRGAVVGRLLAKQLGWQVGQQVEIKELALSFTISAILPEQDTDLERHVMLHRDYLQSVRRSEGRVTVVMVQPKAGVADLDLVRAIDERFAVSEVRTETASEAAYAQSIVERFVGFVRYLEFMGYVTVAVTLLGAANAVSMNVRERLREVGVLRSLGFTPGRILVLILGESALLSVLGGSLGLVFAAVALGSQGALLSGLQLEPRTLVVGFVASLGIGLVGGLLPGLSAIRMSVVDSLRTVD